MEYALIVLCVALATALVYVIVHSQRHVERLLDREREDRQVLLQRIQDAPQAVIDHSVRVVEPQAYYPPTEDDEIAEVLNG